MKASSFAIFCLLGFISVDAQIPIDGICPEMCENKTDPDITNSKVNLRKV